MYKFCIRLYRFFKILNRITIGKCIFNSLMYCFGKDTDILPTPVRKVDLADSIIAPFIPLFPPIKRAYPKLPL